MVIEIRASGGEARFVLTDTSPALDNEVLVSATMTEYVGLHISINNGGIGGPWSPLGEYPLEGWQYVIRDNLSAVFFTMLNSGAGSKVDMVSIFGHDGTKK